MKNLVFFLLDLGPSARVLLYNEDNTPCFFIFMRT